jgi:hypothetical protein
MASMGSSVLLLSAQANDYVSQPINVQLMVPDTGQVECYDTHKSIPCPKPGEPFYGQDGNYFINTPEHKLITKDGVEILSDLITGLNWQRIPDNALRSWDEAIDYTAQLELAGFDDWRLPEKHELVSILSYGNAPASLILPAEKTAPDNAKVDKDSAWTLTTRMFPSLNAKAITLDDNQGTISDKYEKKYVYAVRGPVLVYGQYINNGDGTITDQTTGLSWQTIEVRPRKWEQALAYCEQLELGGFTDWRLPTIKEFSSLVNEKQVNPAINTTFFPTTRSAPYWTGTTFAKHPGFAWYINFENGLEHNGGYKGRQYHVRAVRGGLVAAVIPEPVILPRPGPVKVKPLVPAQPELPETPETPEVPGAPETPKQAPMDLLEPYPLDMRSYE